MALYSPFHDWNPILRTDANSLAPVQTPQNVASDQGLHCLLTGNSCQITVKNKNTKQKHLKLEMDSSKIRMDKSTKLKKVKNHVL